MQLFSDQKALSLVVRETESLIQNRYQEKHCNKTRCSTSNTLVVDRYNIILNEITITQQSDILSDDDNHHDKSFLENSSENQN